MTLWLFLTRLYRKLRNSVNYTESEVFRTNARKQNQLCYFRKERNHFKGNSKEKLIKSVIQPIQIPSEISQI